MAGTDSSRPAPHPPLDAQAVGLDHDEDGVMAETLAAGTRRVPYAGSDLMDVAVLDRLFVGGGPSLAALCTDNLAFAGLVASAESSGTPAAPTSTPSRSRFGG